MGRVSVNITTFPISTLKTNRHDAGLYSGDNCGKLFSKSADLKLNVDPIHDGIRYSVISVIMRQLKQVISEHTPNLFMKKLLMPVSSLNISHISTVTNEGLIKIC